MLVILDPDIPDYKIVQALFTEDFIKGKEKFLCKLVKKWKKNVYKIIDDYETCLWAKNIKDDYDYRIFFSEIILNKD